MTPSLAVGITGGSGAGKTTLARRVAATLGHATLLDLDSYYLDQSALSQKSRDRLNFDQPDAFDVTLLLEHLHQLRRGRPVEKPRYSFEHHTRCGFEPVRPAPIVLVEGLFALWWEELRALFDLKVFLDAPSDLRLARRLTRDVTDRGRSAASVLEQYEATVRPMHDLYVEPTRAHADVVLINDHDLPTCVGALCTALRAGSPSRLRSPLPRRRAF